MTQICAGIDVGGGSAKIGLVSGDGDLVRQTIITLPSVTTPDAVVDVYMEPITNWLAADQTLELSAVGIGVPGHVIKGNTEVYLCNISLLDNFPIVEHVSSTLGVPVTMENDATYAGLGEFLHGAGQGSERFMMATLGTGIGIVYIENGTIIKTSNGTIGDGGHMIVDRNFRHTCRKGCWGCIESVASGLAMTRDAREFATLRPGGALGQVMSSENRDPTVRDIFDGAADNDPDCIKILDETACWLGMWSASMVHIFNPDRVVFGGGWSASGQSFIDTIFSYASRCGIGYYYNRLRYIPATLGNNAGIIGAASDAFRKFCS
ncbi:MAG: ROK family protein [Rhodobacteraceae bacterium]|nr:ROK family protein [Paracoccaceae bacterium]